MTTSTPTLPLLRAVPLAAVLAAVAVGLVHLLFDALGADFVVEPPGRPRSTVVAGQAALIAFCVTLLGCAVSAVLSRRVRRPDLLFLGLVVLALLVTAPNPVTAADQPLTVVALEVEHLVAAGVASAVMLPVLRSRRR